MLYKPDQRNIIKALTAIRHKRIEQEYAKTQAHYSPPSYKAKVTEWIEQKECSEPVVQGYIYTNLVINDETSKAMEYRDLLKDPKYK